MKKHPIITEIQLGKSVEEVIKDRFSGEAGEDYYFEMCMTEDMLPEIIREIIRIGKSDLRFVVEVTSDSCGIMLLNAETKLDLNHYWDDDDTEITHFAAAAKPSAREDEAATDCLVLNRIVDALYGTKRKNPHPKITKEQFISKNGKICPYCGSTKKIVVLDGKTWANRDGMGCRKCGAIWDQKYKIVTTGYQSLQKSQQF